MAAPSERILPALGALSGDFLRYAGPRAPLGAVLIGLGALLEGVGLLMLVPILGIVVQPGKDTAGLRRMATVAFDAVGARTPFEQLALLILAFGAVVVLRGLVTTARDVVSVQLQIGFLQHQRQRVTQLLADASWSRIAGLRHNRVIHLMSGDLQRVAMGANYLVQACVAVVMLIGYTLPLFLAPLLAAIAIALLAIIGVAVAPIVRRSQALGRLVTESNLSMLESTTQLLGGLKLAVSQSLQGPFVRRVDETLTLLTRRQVENVRQSAYARLALSILTAGVVAAIVLLGYGVMRVPGPVLITLLVAIQRMQGPVSQLQQGVQQVAYALPAYEHLRQVQAELAAAAAPPLGPPGPFPEGPVEFEHVTFQHSSQREGGSQGVTGLDLALKPGDFIGVAGASGAGKTTFADLLVGLLAPQAGRISVGGAPLEGATLAAWRGGVSYVSQDPILFHDSVRQNLAWAAPGATESEMWRMLAATGAETLVRHMDNGLDTVVGERGALISGGERQRIALARALLRRPRLLVLDEATNAIDVPSERVLLERLEALDPRPMIVLIAHRSESLALCDVVLRIEEGSLCAVERRGGASRHPFAAQRLTGI